MQNYKDLVLENQIGNLQMLEPIQDGTSKIDKYPLDVVEKLGKYQFVYDFQVRNPIFDNLNLAYFTNTGIKKESGSNTNGTYNFDGDGTGLIKGLKFNSNTVNPNPQVGNFSKGNIVNVIRFDGNNAIIENPNFVLPDPNAPKSIWSSLMVDLTKQKEFSIPKNFLQKVDDSTPITIQTGINFGANPIPQPVDNYTKPIPQTTVLEENASFVFNNDFKYVSGFEKLKEGIKIGALVPVFSTFKAGTKISGRLIRKPNLTLYRIAQGGVTPPPYNDFLVVNGVGADGFIEIPIEQLKRDIPNNTQNNNSAVVPVKNNNKNLLMIVGAFLVGYVLFNKKTPSN
jgi:hypothetical protein